MESKGWFTKLSSGKVVLILLAIFIVIRVLASLSLARFQEMTSGIGILDAEINYTAETAYQMLSDMGQGGRGAYLRMMLIWDFVHPLSLCLFSVAAILFFFRDRSLAKLLISVPILALVFDCAENGLIISMLLQYPDRLPLAVSVANVLTILKLVFGYGGVLIILVGIVVSLIKRLPSAMRFWTRKNTEEH